MKTMVLLMSLPWVAADEGVDRRGNYLLRLFSMLKDQLEQGVYLLVLPVSHQWGGWAWTWRTKLVVVDVGVGSVLTEEAILVTVSLDTDVCNVVT